MISGKKRPRVVKDPEYFMTKSEIRKRRRRLTGPVTVKKLNLELKHLHTKEEVLNMDVKAAKTYMEQILNIHGATAIERQWGVSKNYINTCLKKKIGFRGVREIRVTGPFDYVNSHPVTVPAPTEKTEEKQTAVVTPIVSSKEVSEVIPVTPVIEERPYDLKLQREIKCGGEKVENFLKGMIYMLNAKESYDIELSVVDIKLGLTTSIVNENISNETLEEIVKTLMFDETREYEAKIELVHYTDQEEAVESEEQAS